MSAAMLRAEHAEETVAADNPAERLVGVGRRPLFLQTFSVTGLNYSASDIYSLTNNRPPTIEAFRHPIISFRLGSKVHTLL